jgi:perosamine synthetase
MHASDLSPAGTQPGRSIPLSQPDLGDLERRYVMAAMESGWISGTGPCLADFERRLGEKVDRQHVVAVANGTLGLELVLRGMGIGTGDEVIVPALTFAAPASSVLAVGASAVLVDISRDTWTIDPARVAEAITPRTRAVIAVDVMGHPADYDALTQLGVPIIEDAAEAHGARYKGRPCGSFGVASVFSFHANKPIATGEGGCVATGLADLAASMRLIANHGMSPDRPYVHELLGRNLRMTNLVAAVGLGQLDRWEELLAGRKRVSDEYDKRLATSGCSSRPVAVWAQYAPWLHTISTDSRDAVLPLIRQRGVDARAIWPTLSSQPLFGDPKHCPVAERVAATALWLPTSSAMTSDDVKYVADAVTDALADAEKSLR